MFVLLLVQVAGVLISGGRGGFILVVNASLLLLWLKMKDKKDSLLLVLLIIIFFLISSLVLLPKIMKNDLFINSSNRVFSYITSNGIDMTETSERDQVYHEAIELIKERPLTGFGFFGYYDYTFFPHNFFLETLLNWGIFFLLFVLYMALLFLHKLSMIIKHEPSNLFALAIFIYPFTNLMFSGTYMSTPLFWFGISYVFVYSFDIHP